MCVCVFFYYLITLLNSFDVNSNQRDYVTGVLYFSEPFFLSNLSEWPNECEDKLCGVGVNTTPLSGCNQLLLR